MNTRVNVILPNRTIKVLDKVTIKGQRSNFIDTAIRYYIESQSKKNLRDQLKAGYLVNVKQGLELAAEWFPIEEEASRLFERQVRKTTNNTKSK